MILWFNVCIAVGYFMSVCSESDSCRLELFSDLEQQMLELLALRRALCLANASRNWPRGTRRRLGRSGGRSPGAGWRLSGDQCFPSPVPE